MAEQEYSPEEKLLKLIKGELKPQPSGAAAGVAEGAVAVPAPAPWRRVRLWLRAIGQPRLMTWLPRINQALVAALAVTCLVVLVGVLRPGRRSRMPDGRTAPPAHLTALEQLPPVVAPSLEAFQSRQLFRPFPQGEAGGAGDAAPPGAQELLAQYVLVGILSGESPVAVIEDAETHKTSTLGVGDRLGELFRVEQILESKVVLSADDGSRYELRL